MISTALNAVPGRYRRGLSLSVRIGTLLLVLGIMAMFVGVAMLAGSRNEKPKEAVEMKETPYAYVTIQNNYRINLLAVDYLGTMQQGETEKEDYYLALFVDGNGDPYYCALRADKKTDLYNRLRAYVADETQVIGDASFDAYYSVHGISKFKNLQQEFDQGIEKYDGIVSEEIGEVKKSIYCLQYICGADEDYTAVVKGMQTKEKLGDFAAILLGAALAACGILLFVRNKKKRSLPAEEQTTYQYPQQSDGAPPQNDSFYRPTAQQPDNPPQQD